MIEITNLPKNQASRIYLDALKDIDSYFKIPIDTTYMDFNNYKFNGASFEFNGSRYFTIYRNATFTYNAITDGDFTIEGFFSTPDADKDLSLFSYYNDDNTYFNIMYKGATDKKLSVSIKIGSGGTVESNALTLTENVFHHFAVVRKDGDIHLYLDGIEQGTPITFTTNLRGNFYDSTVGMYRNEGDSSNSYNEVGNVDEYRCSFIARYTANFTPPSAEFTPDLYQSCLIKMTKSGVYDYAWATALSTSVNFFANYVYIYNTVGGCIFIKKDDNPATILNTKFIGYETDDGYKLKSGYIELTAEEMNADNIMLEFRLFYGNSSNYIPPIIYHIKTTSGSSGGATPQEIWEYETRTITGGSADDSSSDQTSAVISALVAKGYTIRNTERDESGYNYYGLTSDNIWYVIIKEKTDYSTVEYYMNSERRVAYATAWAGRASLVYGDTIKIK